MSFHECIEFLLTFSLHCDVCRILDDIFYDQGSALYFTQFLATLLVQMMVNVQLRLQTLPIHTIIEGVHFDICCSLATKIT
mmetsp:Transcript_23969/g.57860  ORF Transcript_23969/g.57860 Transcript_23969/m.57860 type:complete len:81 (-) Transcript_23969:1307-1549(-)